MGVRLEMSGSVQRDAVQAGTVRVGTVQVGAATVHLTQPDRLPAPRELPPEVPGFTGRATECATLDGWLLAAAREPTVTILAVAGTPGVGKTALAVHWAHRHATDFPDGQLYADLRGYDPAQPLPPAEALAGFLRALGVDDARIPFEPAERAARYRTLVTNRRMLIVLDNARSADQVRDLLPGTPSCLVIVTSRDSLAGLVARYGAHRLDLDLLPAADAVGLLRVLLGRRVDLEPVAAALLADECARLPLGLRIAAELAVARPAAGLADLAAELGSELLAGVAGARRLAAFDAGADPRTAVTSVFSWSYRHLPPPVARAFRLLGGQPVRAVDGYAVAALTGTDLDTTGRLVAALTRAHLVQPTQTGPAAATDRIGMHDLLRAYAGQLAGRIDPETARHDALRRLFGYYLYTATTAMNVLFPGEPHQRPRQRRPGTPTPPLPSPAAAKRWLDAERANLVATSRYSANHGWTGYPVDLAAVLWRYLHTGGHHGDAHTIHQQALLAARESGDRAAEATALRDLGRVHRSWSRYGQAVEYFDRALTIAQAAGDAGGDARGRDNLGLTYCLMGRYAEAGQQLRLALAYYRATGDRVAEGGVIGNLGLVHYLLGEDELALAQHQHALEIHRAVGHREGEAVALDNLGVVLRRQGREDDASELHEQARTIAHEIGDRDTEANALDNLGVLARRRGRYDEALDLHQRARLIHAEIGHSDGEAMALNNLGVTCLERGDPPEAIRLHSQALAIARGIGDRRTEASARNGLGEALLAGGQPTAAFEQHRAALDLATDLGDLDQQARARAGLHHDR